MNHVGNTVEESKETWVRAKIGTSEMVVFHLFLFEGVYSSKFPIISNFVVLLWFSLKPALEQGHSWVWVLFASWYVCFGKLPDTLQRGPIRGRWPFADLQDPAKMPKGPPIFG